MTISVCNYYSVPILYEHFTNTTLMSYYYHTANSLYVAHSSYVQVFSDLEYSSFLSELSADIGGGNFEPNQVLFFRYFFTLLYFPLLPFCCGSDLLYCDLLYFTLLYYTLFYLFHFIFYDF